jgi:ChpA-C
MRTILTGNPARAAGPHRTGVTRTAADATWVTGDQTGVLTGNQAAGAVQIPVVVTGTALAIVGAADAVSTGATSGMDC